MNSATDGETNNFLRLIASGISPEDAIEVAVDAAAVYDNNRKPWGAISGALGMMGREVFDGLCRTPNFDRVPQAFTTYRPFSAEAVAQHLVRSKAAVGPAVRRLIEHGFLEKRREGRKFSVKLLIPRLALTEYGESYSSVDAAPGTMAYDHYRPLGGRVLSLYPRDGG
jgi:hypothetical protein